jgi:hypothetical protein
MCVGYWWGKVKEREYLGDLVAEGKIIHRWNVHKRGSREMCSGLV